MKKILLIIFVLVGLVFSSNVFAYEPIPTHQNLTRKIVETYNKYYEPKITTEQANWIIQGSINEDTPPRWINHFYDPIYQIGWSGEKEGDISQSTVQKLSKIFLTPNDAVSSINWLHNENLQDGYGFYEGNQTYDRALQAYAYADNLLNKKINDAFSWANFENAFLALGHSIHLLEDLGVPAHTRNDTHADIEGSNDSGEPYEKWLIEGDNSNLDFLSNLDINSKKISCEKIDDCFINLAKYSNENFYSKDTIDDKKYKELDTILIKSDDFGNLIHYRKDEFNNLYPFKIYIKDKKISIISDSIIHQAYWQLLSKQIVLAGVETLRIFFKDTKDEIENTQYPKNFVMLDLPNIPSFVSIYGTLAKIGNAASSLWGKTTSGISGIFASIKNVFGSAFSSEDEFQQLGEMDIDNNNGGNNSISVSSNNQTQKSVQPKTADIIITEIMYDPQGADSGREWIEIYNNDDSNADLTGWKFFENDTNHNLKLVRGSNVLKSFEYAVIIDDVDKFLKDYPQYQGTIFESSFSLRNDGETIAIKSGDVKIDEVNYKTALGANGNGNSLQLIYGSPTSIDTEWKEGAPTPGKPNKISASQNTIGVEEDKNKQTDKKSEESTNEDLQENNQTPKSNFSSCNFTTSQSPDRSKIIINEVAWMGTTNSASDEWVELKNISNQEIDIIGWQLVNKNESIGINFKDLKTSIIIKPGKFILLERTNDDSAPPKADLIYTGALSNKDDGLKLFDSQCVLADEVLANPNWPAGDNNSKKTMERNLSGFGWHISASMGGTPKKENSQGSISY